MKRKSKSPGRASKDSKNTPVKVYTLDVLLTEGPITDAFAEKHPEVSRTIQIRGDQTLRDLHGAIFEAFDRYEGHPYEFQFDEGTKVRQARTKLDELKLTVGSIFDYLFDFGDEWWHEIKVKAIEEAAPTGEYPRIINKVGECPPQYDYGEDDGEYHWGDNEDR